MPKAVPVRAGRYVAFAAVVAVLGLALPGAAQASGGSGGTSFMPGGSRLANGTGKSGTGDSRPVTLYIAAVSAVMSGSSRPT